MGKAGRDSVLANWNEDKMLEKVERVYQQLIDV